MFKRNIVCTTMLKDMVGVFRKRILVMSMGGSRSMGMCSDQHPTPCCSLPWWALATTSLLCPYVSSPSPSLGSSTQSKCCSVCVHGWEIAVNLRNFRKTKLSKSKNFFFFFFFLTLFQHTYNVQLDEFRFATYANIAFRHFTALRTAKPPSSFEHA